MRRCALVKQGAEGKKEVMSERSEIESQRSEVIGNDRKGEIECDIPDHRT